MPMDKRTKHNKDNPGNTKKFLYKSPQRDDQDDWIFSPRKNEQSPRADRELDMENVWSIKKNVSLGGAGTGRVPNGNTDGLNLKANKTYYSRYGGVKGRDEFGSSQVGALGAGLNQADSSVNNRSWNYSSKGFSYSSFGGGNQPSKTDTTSPNRQSPQYSAFTAKTNSDSSLW
ncbi:uncharacterized protein LOC117327124 isoform X2 [Pecten maximus]|uniref:uncharacterized protein LOC117327124 isoform X2 n=1 Tax=Pecten maximus TaxID=6579 RepID=UPI001458BAF6|nr:uncharacterized protein LOC117327124 isoform X2 [Pecten maximus]